jgi:hypothetical protein
LCKQCSVCGKPKSIFGFEKCEWEKHADTLVSLAGDPAAGQVDNEVGKTSQPTSAGIANEVGNDRVFTRLRPYYRALALSSPNKRTRETRENNAARTCRACSSAVKSPSTAQEY